MSNLKDYIAVLESGSRQKGGAIGAGIPSLGAEHLNTSGKFNLAKDKLKFISYDHYAQMKTGKIRKKDVLVVKDGATTGKVSYVDDDFPFDEVAINEHVFLLRPKDELLSKYLFYYLYSPNGQRLILTDFRGATVGGISRNFINIPIPLPLPEVQRKIVDALDCASAFIEKRKEQIEKLDLLIKLQFIEMFGSVHKNKKYPYLPIKAFAKVTSGGTPDRNIEEYWKNGTIRWVKTTELKHNKLVDTDEKITYKGLENSSAKIVPPGTILIAMYGQGKTRGMTGFLMVEATTNQACACILSSKNINQQYLWWYLILSYNELRGMAKGGNQPNLNGEMIKNFHVLCPPPTLQIQFVDFVQNVEALKYLLQQSLIKLEQNYKSLMQKCFRGEVF